MTKEKVQRFSIRKLSVGAASVLIGIGFASYGTQQVDAATADASQVKQEVVQNEAKTDVVENQSQNQEVEKTTLNENNQNIQVNNVDSTLLEKETENSSTVGSEVKSGGYRAQLSTNKNEQVENADNKTKEVENTIKVASTAKDENTNKNKVETNTLNLNQKIKANQPKLLSQMILASKAAVKSEPVKAKQADTELYKSFESNPNLESPDGWKWEVNNTHWFGAKGKYTIDKNDFKKGNIITLDTITTSNNFYSDPNITTEWQSILPMGGVDAIDDKLGKIGKITLDNVNNYTKSLHLTIDADKTLAEDLNLNVSLPKLFDNQYLQDFSIFKGLKDKDFIQTFKTDSGHSYSVTTTKSDIKLEPNHDFGDKRDNRLETGNRKVVVKNVQYDIKDNQVAIRNDGTQVLQITNSGLANIDGIAIRPKFIDMDKDGNFINRYISNDSPAPSTLPKVNNVADKMTVQQLYDMTKDNQVNVSKQSNGNFLVAYNFGKQVYDKDYLSMMFDKYSYEGNIEDSEHKDQIKQHFVDFYSKNGYPIAYIFFEGPGTQDNPLIYNTEWTTQNITPGQESSVVTTGRQGAPLVSSDGIPLQSTQLRMVDDANNGAIVGTAQTLSGKAGANVEIKYTVPNGYVLVPNQNIPTSYNFVEGNNNPIIIHLTHGKKETNATGKLVRVVTVANPDGKAKEVYNKTYTINRSGMQDLVTGKITWNNWTTSNVDAVEVPYINGYTAYLIEGNKSLANSDGKGALTIVKENFTGNNGNDEIPNITENFKVAYKANTQVAHVIFTDTTAHKQLEERDLAGKSGSTDPYNPTELINSYLAKGYKLDKNDIANQGGHVVFDKNDDEDQTYYIDLSHVFTPLHEEHVIKETVHFTTADGKTKLADDYVKTLTFKRDGKHDKVENKDLWESWQPGDTQKFPALKGVYVEGYTPDNEVEEITIKPDSKDIERTITYTPDMQFAHVVYIDDDNKGEILANDDLNGRTNEKSKYTTADRLDEFKNKGYELIKDGTPKEGIIFDTKDKVDQTYEVHFKHRIEDVTDPRILTATFDRIITEKLPDGKDKQIKQHYEIKRTAKQDMVTKAYTFSDWSTADVKEDKADVLTGYTAKINSANPENFISLIDGVPVAKAEKFTNENGKLLPKNITETAEITYNANPQKASITYIDDTTGKTLSKTDVDGHYAEEIKFNPNVEATIKDYETKGYVLKSNDFKNQKYDSDDSKNNFTVHLTHGYSTVTRSKNVTETIHYNYSDGTKAKEDYVASKEFVDGGTQDLVTGETTWNNDWVPANDKFSQVDSPTIDGYTADKSSIPEQDVNSNSSNLEFTVTYTKNPDPVVPKDDNSAPEVEKEIKTPKNESNVSEHNDVVNEETESEPEVKFIPTSAVTKKSSNENKSPEVTKVSTPVVKSSNKVAKTSVEKQGTLPQAGSKDENMLAVAGLAMFSLSSLFGLGLSKKKEN